MSFYSPAEVTAKTGFSIDTLRYYEKIGLLHEVERTPGGRRRFSEADVNLLRLLRCLRDTDMPIADMLRFVELLRGGDARREERLAVLREHDRRVTGQIAQLHEHQRLIRHKIAVYSGEPECDGAAPEAAAMSRS
ncbi:MerR family transcriptional regulator [Prauserella muralis]|uniref:MerR family transcriptional regulator n=1 Tax=Prauserella muralis TaxID=588067 RepID=A0A2V4B8J9_9PSEU|nr:MerR family transcriptional regulator [Prauserella muralis]PXY31476.1 MerR family transcriptional regulator [Prauserella muralis]TWE14177.1 DNA-binding transcriptional MerR regulator [Prauserella muralis]